MHENGIAHHRFGNQALTNEKYGWEYCFMTI